MIDKKLNQTRAKELMKTPEDFVRSEEKISSAIGKMKKYDTCAIPIKDDRGRYSGIITSQEVLSKDFPPSISESKSTVVNPPLISPNTSLSELCEKMWLNDMFAIPVGYGNELKGLINFWDIVDWALDQGEFKSIKISEIAPKKRPEVEIHDELDKAKVKFREKNLSKILVRDENIDSILEASELSNRIFNIPRESMTKGDRRDEKYKRLGIKAMSITKTVEFRLDKDDNVHKMLREMKKHYSSYAVVDDYLITFKDILRYFSSFKAEITQKVIFVTDDKIDELTWHHWDVDLEGFLETYHKKFGKETIKEFKITINTFHEDDGDVEYEMKAKLLTDEENHFVEKNGWNAVIVFHEMIDALRKQVWD